MPGPLLPKELWCETWAELYNGIDEFSGAEPYQWLFRGHRNASWRLTPRIERVCDSSTLLNTELHLFNEFRSKAHLHTQYLPPLEDQVSWLGVMQHYGIPTRLLDWSYSAYVALFFAVEHTADDQYGVLWALHLDTLMKTARKQTSELFNFPQNAVLERPDRFGKMAFPPAFHDDESTGLIASFLPQFHASRLSSQQGCFLLNCNYRTTFESSLAEMMRGEDSAWLYRIVFPQKLRVECLQRLMSFNIHHASLFPDLEGLAKFLTLKIELFPR